MEFPRAFIFDVDGTLVDSNDFHAHSWVKAFHSQGYEISFEQVRPLIGMGGDKLVKACINLEKEHKTAKKLSKEAAQVFEAEYLKQVKPFPEASQLLTYVKDRGAKLAIASSADETVLSQLLRLVRAEHLIDFVVSSAEVSATKPDADLIEKALERLSLEPTQVYMVGDTVYDIEAATKADVATIAFRCGGASEQSLQNAVAIYEGPAELLAFLRS